MKYLAYLNILFGDNHMQNSGNCKKGGCPEDNLGIKKNLPKLVLPSGVKNTPKITIFRMCYGKNGTVKFFETLADNVFRHNYSMMQI
jgi:hypothetical protein